MRAKLYTSKIIDDLISSISDKRLKEIEIEMEKFDNMKEICKLAREKGFKAKTVSTSVTLKYHLGEGKNLLINDTCDYLLLCEIQKWIREELKIDIAVFIGALGYCWSGTDIVDESYVKISDLKDGVYDTYEKCLESAIKQTLENDTK